MRQNLLFIPSLLMMVCALANAQNYDPLNQDIPLDKSYNGQFSLSELEEQFNKGRDQENQQLNTNLPDIKFPDSSKWDQMSPKSRAFWIINQERKARGLMPLRGHDERLNSITDDYAEYLTDNDTFGHGADGLNPKIRIDKNEELKGSYENIWEVLFYHGSFNANEFENFAGLGIYNFLYVNSSANWGHRGSLLKTNYNDNSGKANQEGLIGIGIHETTNFEYAGNSFQEAKVLVIKGLDPSPNFPFNATSKQTITKNATPTIYPNPANKHFRLSNPEKIKSLTLLDAQGRQMIKSNNPDQTIDIEALTSGIYHVQIKTVKAEVLHQKLVVH